MWLAADAAASLARFEADHGVLHINSAGRTWAEQEELIRRYNAGGAANRPPYLFRPAPHGVSWHEKGTAIDTNEIARFKRDGATYGWEFDITTDVVHAQYHPNLDKHKPGTAPAGGGSSIQFDQTVANEQAWLISLGYNLGPAGADGRRGDATIAAYKQYQAFLRAYGYTGAIDGIWGAGTQAAHAVFYASKHAAAPVPAAPGNALTYADIQAGLNRFGYRLKVDNVWGNASHNALGDFQSKHGLKRDYLVGPATRAALGI